MYDPLGWLSPITIRARILLQDVWKQRLKWDDSLDPNFRASWQHIATDLQEATTIELPRKYFSSSPTKPVDLHVFADASMKAYGAMAYLQQDREVAFVMAKSRAAPLKHLTLPRLELKAAVVAAVVAAQLATSVVAALLTHLAHIRVTI